MRQNVPFKSMDANFCTQKLKFVSLVNIVEELCANIGINPVNQYKVNNQNEEKSKRFKIELDSANSPLDINSAKGEEEQGLPLGSSNVFHK